MAPMQKVRVAVWGVGFFGEVHAKTYLQIPMAELVGVYDIRQDHAAKVGQRLGVQVYRDAEELLSDPKIEAVSVCTTDQYHLEPVLALCAAHKHILLEKPMALNVSECDRMITAARQANVKLMVGHLLRFNTNYLISYTRVQRGDIGQVRYLYGRRNNPLRAARRLGNRCGPHTLILHNGVHDLDVMCWFANSRVVEAMGYYNEGVLKKEGYPVSDVIVSILKFDNGALGVMENCWILPDTYPTLIDAITEVTGTAGKIIIDMRNTHVIEFSNSGVEYLENQYWLEVGEQVFGDLKTELEAFVRCVADDTLPPVSGEDGRRAVAAAELIIRSLELGQPVKSGEA